MRPETASSITDDRATPNRKAASRSDFSSNNSTTSDNEYSVIGAESVIPELPFEGGYTAIDKCHDNALSRRTEGIQYNLVIFIIARTTSAARRPRFAQITIREYRQRTGKSERNIYLALHELERKRLIERDSSGAVRACPENFGAAPLPAARRCQKIAKQLAPSSVAALRVAGERASEAAESSHLRPLVEAPAAALLQLTAGGNEEDILSEIQKTDGQLRELGERRTEDRPHGGATQAVGDVGCGRENPNPTEPIDGVLDSGVENGAGRTDGDTGNMDGGFVVFDTGSLGVDQGLYVVRHRLAARLKLTAVRPGCRPRNAAPALQLTAVKPEADYRKPETYCAWNWVCPYLSTDSPLVSIETRNIEEPTTTGARSPLPAETENAYLARFLQPATRIGEALQIDDDAAGRMWRESIARNPELTPREFVIIVRAKLAEWRRVDDTAPGMRVRSLTGLLVRSMPSAVVGALWLAAREQAPADLERDCYAAREILAYADATPRDRAWARAMLAELAESET